MVDQEDAIRPYRRRAPSGRVAATLSLGLAASMLLTGCGSGSAASIAAGSSGGGGSPTAPAATPSPIPTATPAPPSPSPSPTPTPSPSPSPTPVLVPDPLTGQLVTPDVAERHPVAVMIDDLWAARPQSGLSDASIVWQAPAEGGIPRYMAIFQAGDPPAVGPVRSARQYFIAWAAEWHAVYVHVGGSPQALATLVAKGHGQYVYNADEFRWGGRYLWRIKQRSAPHNVYTDGAHLRALAQAVHAPDQPLEPVWTFAPDAPAVDRPEGGTISFAYPQDKIAYHYDRASNTYIRSVTGEKVQTDAGTREPIAPKNVIVMTMHFGPLNDSEPQKKRLEASFVGSGTAWIATNGHTIVGTWKKSAFDGATTFYDGEGQPVTLTAGQTFINVLPLGTKVTIKDGTVPLPPRDPAAARPD